MEAASAKSDEDLRRADIAMQAVCNWNWSTTGNQLGKGGKDPYRGGKKSWSEEEERKEARVMRDDA